MNTTARKTFAALTLAGAITLALAGCSPKTEGTVAGKDTSGGYWYTMTTMTCNANAVCTPNIYPQYMPESYLLVIEEADGEQVSVPVNLEYWDQAEVGDAFDNTEQ